jgi:hypothetical protein
VLGHIQLANGTLVPDIRPAWEGNGTTVATSGPGECHVERETVIGQETNSNESRSNATGNLTDKESQPVATSGPTECHTSGPDEAQEPAVLCICRCL